MSLEEDLFPNLIKKDKVSGKLFKNFFIDIGTVYKLTKLVDVIPYVILPWGSNN